MRFDWNWLLILSLNLAISFAGQPVQEAYAAPVPTEGKSSEGVKVPVNNNSESALSPTSDLETAFKRLNSFASRMTFPAMMPPFWHGWGQNLNWNWARTPDVVADFDWALPSVSEIGMFMPKVNTSDHGDEIQVSAEVPGISAKDLDVSVSDRAITIKGNKIKEEVRKGSDKSISSMERAYGSFARTITLPCKVDGDKAQASLKDGILTITAPKSACDPADGKKLTIQTQ